MGLTERLYYFTKRKIDFKVLQEKIVIPEEFCDSHYDYISILDTSKNYYEGQGICLDIGAYKGWFSYYANQYFNFDKILCVEPNKDLTKEIENKLKDIENIMIDNIALR